MKPLIVIRPEPGCTETVARARALGLDAHGHALFAIEPVAWEPVAESSIDALLIGSGNALRHGGEALDACRGKPVYAVGGQTAQVARDLGFGVVRTGHGNMQALLAGVDRNHARLLRLCGEERVTLQPAPGSSVIERIVYASRPLAMPSALIDLLRQPCVVLLHSAAAARHFAHECRRHHTGRAKIALACLSRRVDSAAGRGWAARGWAAFPEEAALLALAGEMCQMGASTAKGPDKPDAG